MEVNCLVRINPGSNVHGDNKTGTAKPGMTDVNIPEPKMLAKGKIQCPVCEAIFSSREAYDSHALTRHQGATVETAAENTMEPKMVSRTEVSTNT
jgi:hypothetical protein